MEKIKTIRNKIYNSILETIGNTPLIKVPRISKRYNCFGELICKLELISPIKRGIIHMKGSCFVKEDLVSEGEFMAKIIKKDK